MVVRTCNDFLGPTSSQAASILGDAMKCGDKGYTNGNGHPCGQNIAPTAKGCLWHSRTPEERVQLATKGALASKMRKALPADYDLPALNTLDDVEAFLPRLVRMALTENLDPWRLREACKALGLKVEIEQVRATKQQAEAIAALQYGKPAVAIVNQYLGAQPSARRRLIPGLDGKEAVAS